MHVVRSDIFVINAPSIYL